MEFSISVQYEKEAIRHKRNRLLSISAALLVLLVFVGDHFINGQRGEDYHQRLIQEFRAIPPFEGASLVTSFDHFSSWNSHKALVGAGYQTEQPFENIERFYDFQLNSLGWRKVGRRQSEVNYCKGELGASVSFAKTHEFSYALRLTWAQTIADRFVNDR